MYFEGVKKKTCNYAEHVLCYRCFSKNFTKIYRTAISMNFSDVCKAKASGVLTHWCSLTLKCWWYQKDIHTYGGSYSWENWGLQERLKFCKSNLFCELHNKKRLFSIMDKKKTAFFPIFTMDLFSTALRYLTPQSTLNFTWTSLYF